MAGNRRGGSRAGLVLVPALLLVAAIAFFILQTNALNRTYQAEAAITAAPTLSPPAIYAKPTEALLRNGSIGTEVQQLQQRLQQLGYYNGEIDGHFGGGTKNSVVLFQQQHGLEPDGMAGPATIAAIFGSQAHTLQVTPQPTLPGNSADLPILVNRSRELPAGYQPPDLISLKGYVPDSLLILKDEGVRASRPAVDALVQMIQAAKAGGLDVWQVSEGYRTLERQQQLFDNQVRTYMEDDELSESQARSATEKTVARPGTSEHHTGLAFDLTVPGYFFGDTPQAEWLEENCWNYGFILRYTANKEDITGFLPEPWHVRYVGNAHATFMRDNNLALEEYLTLYNR